MNIKNLLLRSASGIIYVGIIVGCIFWGIFPLSCLGAVLGALSVIEFEKICNNNLQRSLPVILTDICGVACLSFSWLGFPLLIWLIIYLFRMILELYLKNDSPLSCLSHSLMSQIYIGIPMGAMSFVGYHWGMHIILAVFFFIWINDTGAFIVGCSIGKNRLFERLSPKKSWEGFFGGLVFNLAMAAVFCYTCNNFWGMDWNLSIWLLFAALVTIFATWGDLLESMIKRYYNIKDSGNIIPGHGGILDRIDSFLLVMPAALIFILFFSSRFLLL